MGSGASHRSLTSLTGFAGRKVAVALGSLRADRRSHQSLIP